MTSQKTSRHSCAEESSASSRFHFSKTTFAHLLVPCLLFSLGAQPSWGGAKLSKLRQRRSVPTQALKQFPAPLPPDFENVRLFLPESTRVLTASTPLLENLASELQRCGGGGCLDSKLPQTSITRVVTLPEGLSTRYLFPYRQDGHDIGLVQAVEVSNLDPDSPQLNVGIYSYDPAIQELAELGVAYLKGELIETIQIALPETPILYAIQRLEENPDFVTLFHCTQLLYRKRLPPEEIAVLILPHLKVITTCQSPTYQDQFFQLAISLTSEFEPIIRQEALDATILRLSRLEVIEASQATEALIAFLEQESPHIRKRALNILLHRKLDERAITALNPLLSHSRPATRIAVTQILRATRSCAASELLKTRISDEDDPRVLEEVRNAILSIKRTNSAC